MCMVLFSAGYGWEMLADTAWLHRVQVWYWGDIDTHVFAILQQLRKRLPHARSFLMDRETLVAHSQAWTTEDSPVAHEMPLLTAQEREAYDLLRHNVLAKNLRLEQELVTYAWLANAINPGD